MAILLSFKRYNAHVSLQWLCYEATILQKCLGNLANRGLEMMFIDQVFQF